MGKLGFYCFTSPAVPVELTPKQKVKALSDDQKSALIVSFRNMIPASQLDHKMRIPKETIEYVYDGIDAIQEKCRTYMRQEVEITPAVLDAEGNILTPAVMNIQPATQTALKDTIQPLFIDDYPATFITAVVKEMVDWSKFDGTGTFTFYKNNIIL